MRRRDRLGSNNFTIEHDCTDLRVSVTLTSFFYTSFSVYRAAQTKNRMVVNNRFSSLKKYEV